MALQGMQMQYGVALGLALPGAVGGQLQHLVPEGARALHAELGCCVRRQFIDLPVQPGQRCGKARIASNGLHFNGLLRAQIDGGTELVELMHQLVLQLLGNVFFKQITQAPASDSNGHGNPDQRAQQQAQPQGAVAQGQGRGPVQLHALASLSLACRR